VQRALAGTQIALSGERGDVGIDGGHCKTPSKYWLWKFSANPVSAQERRGNHKRSQPPVECVFGCNGENLRGKSKERVVLPVFFHPTAFALLPTIGSHSLESPRQAGNGASNRTTQHA